MAWRRKTPAVRTTEDTGVVSAPTDVDAFGHDIIADDAVLGELSRAFADSDVQSDADGVVDAEQDTGTADNGVVVRETDAGAAPRKTIVIGGDSNFPGVVEPIAGVEVGSHGSSDPAIHTIAIGGDDLPDAVYLDDESGSEASAAGAVFIDDDTSGDFEYTRNASARSIEPRIRQRRIGVKRAETRRRLWWVAAAAAVLSVVIALLALLGSSLFAVDEVSVTGNVYTDSEQLAAVVDELRGTPVLRVDIAATEASLEALPWIERARVRTNFPDAASVELVERVPVASMMGADGQVRVLDDEGRVLTLVDGQPVALVWISGLGTLDVAPGGTAPVGPSSAALLVTKLTPNIRERVDSIIVTPDGADLVMLLSSEGGTIEVRFGSAIGDSAQIEKLVRLERALESTNDRFVSVIDVSTSEVTVR